MRPLRSLLRRGASGNRAGDGADIVLGIPLETNGKTIYPVFRDAPACGDTAAEPRKIGFLEISEGRSDFTSLEQGYRPVAVVPVLLIVLAIVIWFLRRDRRT